MRKVTFLSIVCAVLFATVTLFTASNAMAQGESEEPISCVTENGWTVELMGGAPTQIGPGRVWDPEQEEWVSFPVLYKWSYLITKQNFQNEQNFQTTQTECDEGCDECKECDGGCFCPPPPVGLKNFNLSIPVCSPDPILTRPKRLIKWPPGTPGGRGFGKGILQSFVLKWNFSDYPEEVEASFVTNSDNIAKGTAGLVIKEVEGAEGIQVCEIDVPGCPTFALQAVVEESFVSTTDGRKFKQILNPYTQCPSEIYEIIPCDDGVACRKPEQCVYDCQGDFYEWPLDKQPSTEVLSAHGDEGISFIGKQGDGCPGAMVKSEGPDSWFFCFLGWCWF